MYSPQNISPDVPYQNAWYTSDLMIIRLQNFNTLPSNLGAVVLKVTYYGMLYRKVNSI